MKPETLKSKLLLEDSGHSICCFCSSLNIFSNQFDHYCLMSINYFLRNGARNFQKRTFARRQWAQYLLFLFFSQHLFKSIWSLLFDVNQSFSLKWRSKPSKAKFFSKAVGTVFAVFVLFPTFFPIILIFNFWCESIDFSEMKVEGLKSKFFLEDRSTIFSVFSSLNTFAINSRLVETYSKTSFDKTSDFWKL